MTKTEIIVPENRDHWLQLRAQDVTSTEVSALFDCNPWLTKAELWHRKKTGDIVEIEESEPMRWGNRLESSIAYGAAVDYSLGEVSPAHEYIRKPLLRVGSSFDFWVNDHAVLEVKTVNPMIFKDGWIIDGDDIEAPPHIELQVQHQLWLSGLSTAYIAALVGGNKLYLITRERNDRIIERLGNACMEFWVSIAENKPPKFDYVRDAQFIKQLYSHAEPGRTMDATSRAEALASNYKDVTETIKSLEDKRTAIKSELLTIMGESEKLIGSNFSVSARMVGPKMISYERKGYRDFRINFKKGEK